MPNESTGLGASKVVPIIVVAGDVCIDWLSIVVDPVASNVTPPMNWQLVGGRHMYARPGGAWLTADFVKAAVGDRARVLKPEGEPELANVPPEKIIHSMLMLDRRPRERNREKVMFWAVSKFEGYAGPPPGEQPVIKAVENDEKDVTIVMLDDAGNGFRDDTNAWPAALNKDCKPLVIYKVRRPLMEGQLWERLKGSHLERTIALLSADELRGEGATVSRALSWERTATDLVVSVAHDPKFGSLRNCPFLIAPLGVEGVVLMRCNGGQVVQSHLWYEPSLIEGELRATPKGDMSGFGSAFSAAVAVALIRDGCPCLFDYDATERALHDGIIQGLHVQRRLLDEAFGLCEKDKKRQPPDYPSKEIFAKPADRNPYVCVSLPDLPRAGDARKMAEYRSWRILETKRKKVFEELAADVVRHGVKGMLDEIPMGRFGKLVTIDRSEIESYRSIRNLIREFLKNPNPERPLCLAVFGPPGGGKSFGVTQVALDVAGEGQIEKLDFNVSQWDKPDYLIHALHRVRDHALRGKVPLVFFDEFDAKLAEENLGWLKYFLAPMQDGVFADGLSTHQVGKAIFVFAGGIFFTFADFRKEIMGEDIAPDGNVREAGDSTDKPVAKAQTSRTSPESRSKQIDDMKAAKAPDFLSRLRGNVDVFGLDPPVGTNLVRRALVLRSNLEKKFPKLKDSSDAIHIDDGVLRAFLRVPGYEHGARSLEAILEMSNLVGRTHFDPSMLPPRQQLDLHVDGSAFMALVEHHQTLGAKLEEIAKAIHETFLKEELANGIKMGSRPSMKVWEDLDDLYKNSNREQAAYYPYLLRAAGCDFEKDEDGSKPLVKFSDDEIDRLAQMEHGRWVEERRIKQPDHPDLCLWKDLPKKEKDKDIRSVEAIPEILSKVGLRVVRLSEGFRDRSPGRKRSRKEKSRGAAA